MTALSVIVITLNEAAHIAACLNSVRFANEIVVVDSGSSDGTPDLARAAGARVMVHDWPGYAAQKNFAAASASHDWILSIDADERVSPELALEIQRVVLQPPGPDPSVAGYRMPRITWHFDRWVQTTDWYPDYQLRLYDRRRGRWTGQRVHESVSVEGGVASLSQHLQHYAYRDLSHHVETMNRYTTLAAEEMFESGRDARGFELIVHPPAAFLRNYILRRGFRDGVAGFIISAMNAWYVFLKFAKLWALRHAPKKSHPIGD